MRLIRFFVIFMLASILGCSRGSNEKLKEIDALCDQDPRLAMSMLDSIDHKALSGKDRHYYDLLSIKSRDKAYVRHTSDSLVLDVIDYYSSHQDDPNYPEALYYGGRVYSDIGDLPTALEYFQKTIDAIPDDQKYLKFKRNVLNQTGRLLHSLRLDSAAIKYMEKSIAINEELKDNDSGIAYAHALLATAYLNIKDNKSARKQIDSAVQLSFNLPSTHRAGMLLYLADILDKEGKTDSALSVIRPLPYMVDSLALSECLALASELYRDAGILHTAYIYARKLTLLKDSRNKRTGYKVIFSDKLKDYLPKDTLMALVVEYKNTMEEYIDRHEGENAIIQNTRYNYVVHDRERIKAEKKLHHYVIFAFIVVIISLMLLAIILYRKFKTADTTASLATVINILKESSETYKEGNEDAQTESKDILKDERDMVKQREGAKLDSGHPENIENPERLSQIKNSIISGIRTDDEKDLNSLVNPAILVSPTYQNLLAKITSESCITQLEEKKLFKDIEDLVESVSPGFAYRLRILTEGKVTPVENRIAMLIKCGFAPLQISVLLGKEKNTISTHRRNLAFKITGQKKSNRSLDVIIISL